MASASQPCVPVRTVVEGMFVALAQQRTLDHARDIVWRTFLEQTRTTDGEDQVALHQGRVEAGPRTLAVSHAGITLAGLEIHQVILDEYVQVDVRELRREIRKS